MRDGVGPYATWLTSLLVAAACARSTPADPPSTARPLGQIHDGLDGAAPDAPSVPEEAGGPVEAAAGKAVQPRTAIDGPHYLLLAPGRPIFYALPAAPEQSPARLVGHVHGTCGAPSYACGKWIGAGVDVGVLVCPTGNATCGDSPNGPPSWEAASWPELVVAMDRDLEHSIAKVIAKHPDSIRREGAVLTGYSRGGYAAPILAGMHPKRWPFLVIIEADATLTLASLRRAGVRAVALVAGELGNEIVGMRKSAETLAKAGFPAQLFIMPRTGHLYSTNMDEVMQRALTFVLAEESDAGVP